MRPQIKDGITHQLPEPVKRNVPAAIAFEDLYAATCQRIGRSEYVGSSGVAAESNHRWMFKQQQNVADRSRLAQIDQRPLQPQTFAVMKPTELDHRNHVASEIIGQRRTPEHRSCCQW